MSVGKAVKSTVAMLPVLFPLSLCAGQTKISPCSMRADWKEFPDFAGFSDFAADA
jgi:hypothetical protein